MGTTADRESTGPWAQTGLYEPHHRQLVELAQRAADIMPRHHDAAQLIREAVPRRLLCEKLRAVAEVHFNAQASLRWLAGTRGNGSHGGSPSLSAAPLHKVLVGDIVLATDSSNNALDAWAAVRDGYEPMTDRAEADTLSDAHQDWAVLAEDATVSAQQRLIADGVLRVVRTAAEAATYKAEQVLLPTLGRGAGVQVAGRGDSSASEATAGVFHALTRELRVGGLPSMRTAPPAGLRHLLCRPRNLGAYLFDEQRGWDWVLNHDDGSTHTRVGTALKSEMYKDHEGIFRVRSPVMALSGKNMIARRGVRGGGRHHDGVDLARHHFLKPARRAGMTCVLRMELPRGSPITSALREAFQFVTLSPSGIYHLIARR